MSGKSAVSPAPKAAEARALALRLGPLVARARYAAAAITLGAHGRRRPGLGENFWQFRPYQTEDSVSRVDWRRSARGDRLFVRERELEHAQRFFLWLDRRPDFDWRSSGAIDTKRDYAAILLLALAAALRRGGENVAALGAEAGETANFDRLALALYRGSGLVPTLPRGRGIVVLASDFYEPPALWRARLAPFRAQARRGVLVATADPAEILFPFSGRVRFHTPSGGAEPLVERAEAIAPAYRAAFAERRDQIAALAHEMGWDFVACRSDAPAGPSLAALAALIGGGA